MGVWCELENFFGSMKLVYNLKGVYRMNLICFGFKWWLFFWLLFVGLRKVCKSGLFSGLMVILIFVLL